MDISLQPIGIIHSPFREKFGVPRQPGLVNSAIAELELLPPFNRSEALRGLEEFSHLWLIFLFHQNQEQGWRPTVRPPRLGGNDRVGVFASRSPFRPNPLGLSAVELLRIRQEKTGPVLELKGIDLVDGTPVVDLKPYLPYTDALPQARGGFAPSAPETTTQICFSPAAERQLAASQTVHPQLRQLIVDLLSHDPRPAYRRQQEDEREYGARLYDYNLRWRVDAERTLVIALDPA